MPDVLTSLTSLAVSVFRARTNPGYTAEPLFDGLTITDGILQQALRDCVVYPTADPAMDDLVAMATSQADLQVLAGRAGELDPMVMHPGGGMRMSAGVVFAGLLSSVFLQMYFLRLPREEGTFVRTVLEGFEELRRAARGERVRAHAVAGIAGITLPEGAQITTPWGLVRPAPPVETQQVAWPLRRPKTSCVLAEPRLLPIRFDRAASPEPFDRSEMPPDISRVLFPLSCALASRDTIKPVVPLLTWSTLLIPFEWGFRFSESLSPPLRAPEVDVSDRIEEIEQWADVVDRAHAPAVDIAAGRLISAVANRVDRSDSLIDAVMVWENLVGTSSEVTFRVTAALAKLLESDPTKRMALRKELANIYDTRSRVVHGAAVKPATVDKACSSAIDVAVRALRAAYRKGQSWLALSSHERADEILLEWL